MAQIYNPQSCGLEDKFQIYDGLAPIEERAFNDEEGYAGRRLGRFYCADGVNRPALVEQPILDEYGEIALDDNNNPVFDAFVPINACFCYCYC